MSTDDTDYLEACAPGKLAKAANLRTTSCGEFVVRLRVGRTKLIVIMYIAWYTVVRTQW